MADRGSLKSGLLLMDEDEEEEEDRWSLLESWEGWSLDSLSSTLEYLHMDRYSMKSATTTEERWNSSVHWEK